MPNYIKKRIELIGNENLVKELIEKVSTFYPEKQQTSYDGDLTFKNSSGEFGWLNEKTNIFHRRGVDDIKGIPAGFEKSMKSEFTQFPDFEKIVKMPESLNISSDGWLMPLENEFSSETKFKAHLDECMKGLQEHPESFKKSKENLLKGISNYIDYGHATWYGWSVANWGTKWNSSECEKISENTFDFITAWSGVPDLINKLSKQFPEVTIIYEYSDEDTGRNCGKGKYLNGEIQFKKLDSQSIEAYDMAFKLRPDYKENYQLVDGKYEYIDEE